MKNSVQFTACRYLDYRDNYTAKKVLILLGEIKVCWERPIIDDSYPKLVQFCKLRGRLNHPEMCTSKKDARCSEYRDFQHSVDYEP
jgi:hypothetical protein